MRKFWNKGCSDSIENHRQFRVTAKKDVESFQADLRGAGSIVLWGYNEEYSLQGAWVGRGGRGMLEAGGPVRRWLQQPR